MAAELVSEVSRHYLVKKMSLCQLIPHCFDFPLQLGDGQLAGGNLAVGNQITYEFLIFVGFFLFIFLVIEFMLALLGRKQQ